MWSVTQAKKPEKSTRWDVDIAGVERRPRRPKQPLTLVDAPTRRFRRLAIAGYLVAAIVVAIFGVNVSDMGLVASVTPPAQAEAAAKPQLTAPAPDLSTATTGEPTTTITAIPGLFDQLTAYMQSRHGVISAEVYDTSTGTYYGASSQGATSFDTASIVKVALLVDLLVTSQDQHRGLTAQETKLAREMIAVSDNNATTTLWNELGKDDGFNAMLARIGTTSTRTADDTQWGLTQTTARDQITILRTITEHNDLLSDANRTLAQSFLAKVVGSQHWGVSAGVANGNNVLLKDGWLQRDNGIWDINSVGYVNTGAHPYVISVLTTNDPSEAYGIATTQDISNLVWSAIH